MAAVTSTLFLVLILAALTAVGVFAIVFYDEIMGAFVLGCGPTLLGLALLPIILIVFFMFAS